MHLVHRLHYLPKGRVRHEHTLRSLILPACLTTSGETLELAASRTGMDSQARPMRYIFILQFIAPREEYDSMTSTRSNKKRLSTTEIVEIVSFVRGTPSGTVTLWNPGETTPKWIIAVVS